MGQENVYVVQIGPALAEGIEWLLFSLCCSMFSAGALPGSCFMDELTCIVRLVS